MWDRVCEVLTDFEFLQAKIGALPEQEGQPAPASVFELLQDFVEALQAMPQGHARRQDVERLHRAIDSNSHVLKETPWLLVQQVYNAWQWEADGLGGLVAQAERACARVRQALGLSPETTLTGRVDRPLHLTEGKPIWPLLRQRDSRRS